jgi:hypothetical protein
MFTFSASAESANLVADGRFEDGFSGWQVLNNSGKTASYEVISEGENSVLKAVSGLSMFKQVELKAGVTYIAGFDFKFDTNAAVPSKYDSFYRAGFTTSVAAIGGSIFVGPNVNENNKYYNIYGNQRSDSNNWKSHSFTFTPTTNMTTYFVVGSFNHQGEANFFVDNVYLAKATDLVTVTTVAGDGGSVSGNVKTFKGDLVTVNALPSSGYEFDGWYNALNQKLSGDLNYSFEINDNIELTAKFKVSTTNPNLIINGDFAVQNLNDFEVYKNGNNSSSNFEFTAFGEDYVLSGKAGHSLFKRVDLVGGVSYTMSFDFRFKSADVPSGFNSFYRAGFTNSVAAISGSIFVGYNATDNKYYSTYIKQMDNPTAWKNHSFTFTPSSNMSVYAVIGSYNHECVADFELDNWLLCKTSDLISVTAVAEEGGSVTGTNTVLVGKTVKLTATANDGYNFIGWYNEDVLVSTDAEYIHTATQNITLIARFESTAPISNYIVNGDFETPFTTNTISNVSQPAVLGVWGKIYSGVARMEAIETANFTSSDSAELNGTRYITSGATKDANQYVRAFGQYTNLPAGEYVLEFDAKSTSSSLFAVSVCKGQGSINAHTDLVNQKLDESSEWKHYEINFTAATDGTYQIAFGGNTQGGGTGDFSIDNVSLEVYVEENPNLIINGDFEEPFTTNSISNVNVPAVRGEWGKIYSGVARMEAVESNAFTSADSTEFNGTRYITSGATKDTNQYIRAFGQYVELTKGDYVFEFDAKSNSDAMFVASISKGQESINTQSALVYKNIDESSEWKHYIMKFTASEDGLYQFAFGGNSQGKGAGDFSIDNVGLFSADGYFTVTAITDGGGKVTYPNGRIELGSTATIIATAENGYVFVGWFKGNELISADASYSFVVTESVEYKAKFELDLGDDDAIVKNGKFDVNSTAGWVVKTTYSGSKAEVIVDPDTGSAVAHTTGKGAVAFMQKVTLKAGTEYLINFNLKFDDYASIPKDYDSFYRSGFLANPDGNLGNANFIGPNTSGEGNVYHSLASKITTKDKNAWNTISYTYTPLVDGETWFVIGAFNNQAESNYSIDNIVIVPSSEATVVSVTSVSRGGSGTAYSGLGGLVSPGETVKLIATPNKGSAFGGWYINGVLLSNSAQFDYEVKDNCVIYARFVDEKNPDSNQLMDNFDFSTGDLSGWETNNIATAKDTVEYVTVKGESYVKLSECDMLYQPVEIEPYSTYIIRITTRIPDIREKSYGVHDLSFFRYGISEFDKPNVLQSGALEKDPFSYTSNFTNICDCMPDNRYHCVKQWNTYTYTYSNNSPDTILANVVVGTPYCKSDLHIKSFEFVKFVDGIVDFDSDILYGEDFFNNVKNPSFEDKTTDSDWGKTLPKGWTIKNEGKKGTNYLSVSGNETKTYTFRVRAGMTYVVAFNLRTNRAGNATVSIVDDKGNPWGDSFNLRADKAAFSPKANGKWQRMGAHLYLADNSNGYVNINIKITGGSNVLDIDEVTITKLGYATHNVNPNVYTDNSFDYDNPLWYDPTTFYKLPDGTTIDGAVDDPYAKN